MGYGWVGLGFIFFVWIRGEEIETEVNKCVTCYLVDDLRNYLWTVMIRILSGGDMTKSPRTGKWNGQTDLQMKYLRNMTIASIMYVRWNEGKRSALQRQRLRQLQS